VFDNHDRRHPPRLSTERIHGMASSRDRQANRNSACLPDFARVSIPFLLTTPVSS
jgi:hypothetical protein